MKFVDEAKIKVQAGKGGDGCLGFRREKYIPRGGPNGGDGGDGGSVFLQVDPNINTLVDFQYKRQFKAANGQGGKGNLCTGPKGEDLVIKVPRGTLVYDKETNELIADMTEDHQKVCVAQGGFHGLGNTRFKSSINQAPRKFTKGTPGDERDLHLELKLLADVGLLGFPNAGKSTLVQAMSAARPKVADYPFTTINPSLGVVRVDECRSFVMADIPGIIEGAAEGAGLGVRFLKHMSRTALLLHVVDIAPIDGSVPAEKANQAVEELKKFNDELASRERWLVLNKTDILPEEDCKEKCQEVIDGLNWQGPVFAISAATKHGTEALSYAIMEYIEASNSDDPDLMEAFRERFYTIV